jgi:hypothetical protein
MLKKITNEKIQSDLCLEGNRNKYGKWEWK